MKRLLKCHPVLIAGLVTVVLMWTSPSFVPAYDDGRLGLPVAILLYVLTRPFAFFRGLLRPMPLPEIAGVLLSQVLGLMVYAAVDWLVVRYLGRLFGPGEAHELK